MQRVALGVGDRQHATASPSAHLHGRTRGVRDLHDGTVVVAVETPDRPGTGDLGHVTVGVPGPSGVTSGWIHQPHWTALVVEGPAPASPATVHQGGAVGISVVAPAHTSGVDQMPARGVSVESPAATRGIFELEQPSIRRSPPASGSATERIDHLHSLDLSVDVELTVDRPATACAVLGLQPPLGPLELPPAVSWPPDALDLAIGGPGHIDPGTIGQHQRDEPSVVIQLSPGGRRAAVPDQSTRRRVDGQLRPTTRIERRERG